MSWFKIVVGVGMLGAASWAVYMFGSSYYQIRQWEKGMKKWVEK